MMKFTGTENYVATDDLRVAVNAAVTLQRPLLVKGEPGTGKTQLAEEIAARSTGRCIQLAHQVHHQGAAGPVRIRRRLAPARLAARRRAKVHDIGNYIVKGRLWEAFESDVQPVLLIDEIDKADIEFPNDLLLELDRMEFYVYETRQRDQGASPPDRDHHVQQREGAARRLPAPLLLPLHPLPRRRDDGAHRRGALPGLKSDLLAEALTLFFECARCRA